MDGWMYTWMDRWEVRKSHIPFSKAIPIFSHAWFAASSKVQTYGKPAVGGPFSLVDEDGRPVTEASYPGKYLLIYFGFTYCPDICPSELVKVGKIIEKLGWLRACRLLDTHAHAHSHTHMHKHIT